MEEEIPENQQYHVAQYDIGSILEWVKLKNIAIPEIQRPFVWDTQDVRDLIDSLYKGYPVGFLITWSDQKIKLKKGGSAAGKRILIDGQQRVTALMTSILGEQVLDKEYRKKRIQIAFQPMKEEFASVSAAIAKDKRWIPDIGVVLQGQTSTRQMGDAYVKNNPEADIDHIDTAINNLLRIKNRQIGVIELKENLPIETVTDIFVRANKSGVLLTEADFVMAKLASFGDGEGSDLRKCIDLFCHMAIKPEAYDIIKTNDAEFTKTGYFKKISWLKNEQDDFYDPKYTDLLRVAFSSRFDRGKLTHLVSLLSGRNFETRQYEEKIKTESFKDLEAGVLDAINETHFQRFIMILRSAGIISKKFYTSVNNVNLSYVLYIRLKAQKMPLKIIEKLVKKWFVMSNLTGRYSGSSDTTIEDDVKNFKSKTREEYLEKIEKEKLSDAFWDETLISSLQQASSSSAYLGMFWAAQVNNNEKAFLSKDHDVRELIEQRGDIHHIFPKAYLQSHGITYALYGQSANFAWTQQEINIKLGKKSPKEYMNEVKKQCKKSSSPEHGSIDTSGMLEDNLKENCIPNSIYKGTISNYESFLEERRKLMVQKIRDYYSSL